MKKVVLCINFFVATFLNGMSCDLKNVLAKFPWAPTPIASPQTISTSGNYCLAQNITGNITISASNVYLDLNNHRLTGALLITSGLEAITIKNGLVDGTGNQNGITVSSGCSNITCEKVTVQNAVTGLHCVNSSKGKVNNCSFSQNTTGVHINASYNFEIQDSTASQNIQAGFELLSSTTNTFFNCKAINTGYGNTNASGDESFVYGFVARDSVGNIFEQCIANSTQNLVATDYDTIVAGFALWGTGTQCNKIIECEASNATTNASGYTVPYGIFLGSAMSGLDLVASEDLVSFDSISSVDWSPDGQYIVAGGRYAFSGGGNCHIDQFDSRAGTLDRVTGIFGGTVVNTVDWSPYGQYIAVGGNAIGSNEFHVIKFDPIAGTVSSVAEGLGGLIVNAVAWSPHGQYIAVGGQSGSLVVQKFDPVTESLSVGASGIGFGGTIRAIDWSPDEQYIVAGGSTASAGRFQVFKFDPEAATLSFVDGVLTTAGIGRAVGWSPDGQYIAVGGDALATGNLLQIFKFDSATETLSFVDGALTTPTDLFGVDWSPDGQYIAVGVASGGNLLQIFKFDPVTEILSFVDEAVTGGTQIGSVSWRPDGAYLGMGGFGFNPEFQVRNGLDFPSKNIIKNNTAYCNSTMLDSSISIGVGISGSSIENLIIQNTSYNNPFNFVFVQNEFNQLFGSWPTAVQNIGLVGCDPITAPCDCGEILRRNNVLIQSIVDLIP